MKALFLALTLGLLALLTAGCAASAANATPVLTDQVDMPPSYKFSPPVVQVQAGATVTWTNHDNFTHSVQLLPGGKPLVAQPGQTVQIKFDKPGTYNYICSFHPQNMQGQVIVVAGSTQVPGGY